jgi:hypothetical protein
MGIRLSLTVAAKGECDAQSFLAALDADGVFDAGDVDVHIAHDGAWPTDATELPATVHLHACPADTSILQLWGVAMVRCGGDYVAALDIHCPPTIGWLDSVLAEIEKGSVLFFGPVDSGWDKTDRRIVGYLNEYAQFSSPLADALSEVPGNNIVCQRGLLDADETLQTQGFYKTFMVWRLAAEQGLSPQRCDDMIIRYQKPFRLGHYMTRFFTHGRCFGATRHDNANQPARLLCTGFTIVLPLVRSWRVYKAVRQRDELRAAFYRFLPLVLLSECAWSAGEFCGYVFGGRSCCNKLD